MPTMSIQEAELLLRLHHTFPGLIRWDVAQYAAIVLAEQREAA